MTLRPNDRDRESKKNSSIYDTLVSIPTMISIISVYIIFLVTYYAPSLRDWGVPAVIFILPIALATVVIPVYLHKLFQPNERKR